MPSAGRPWWQQATALVSLGAGGAITGFSFVPRPAADLTSPSSMPVGLMALEKSAQPAQADSDALRSAIINVANYYLRMAQTKSPAEMEAIIWQRDSLDGVDHGESCAAFASLTLELGANVVGKQSWATGGSTYPWPLHKWADVRVNPNPGSPGVTSMVQDAQAHQRWHPVGDGYQPQPGDWVVFDGHVEVVTKYDGGVLDTIGGDSVPNFSVNAHQYSGPLSGQGVLGFVNNGDLPTTTADAAPASEAPAAGLGQPGQEPMAIPGTVAANPPSQQTSSTAADAAIPGTADAPAPAASAHPPGRPGRPGEHGQPARRPGQQAQGHVSHRPRLGNGSRSPATAKAGVAGNELPGAGGWSQAAMADTAAIPGLPMMAHRLGTHPAAPTVSPYRRHSPPPAAGAAAGTSSQQAFISAVAPAAVATQTKYGVPASVTIAQAIDESGWGQSNLAIDQHNLFGIKGTGPAGSYQELTQEYENGQLVTSMSSFRVYRNAQQSVDDHGKLLATSGYYRRAMAVRGNPNAFAASLTGVYATDPGYGAKLIRLMQQYDLYRYDSIASAGAGSSVAPRPARPNPSVAANPGQSAPGPTTRPAGQGPTQAGSPTGTPAPAMAGSPAQGAWIPGTSVPGGTAPGGSVPGASLPGGGGAGAAAGRSAPAARTTPGTPAGAPRGTAPRAVSQATAPPAQRGRAAQAGSSRPRGAPTAPSAPGGPPLRTSAGSRSAPGSATASRSANGTSTAIRPGPATGTAGRSDTGASTARRSVAGASTARRPAGARAANNAPVAGSASIPGVAAAGSPGPAQAAAPAASPRSTPRRGSRPGASASRAAAPSTNAVSARLLAADVGSRPPRPAARPAPARAEKYRPQIPQTVRSAYVTRAKDPLLQAEPLYRDVAEHSGLRWQLLAACDWMQCRAAAKYSPVHGEKLGTVSADGTSYRTKSEALEQCAEELAALAWTVYGIDLAARRYLSVRELANVFAAFRWGGLLRRHRTSAMEFPYSVAGLTGQHLKMRWPNIDDPRAPDKPGGRFRMPFGAVPVVLFLNYPATV